MIINHNMASLNTYRQMSTNMTNTSKSLEKLSSGLRINRAGDDAAGLAISEKMRGQIRGLDQAARNGQDGISMLNTAEGALSETHSILQRMKELATQSANDTNTSSDRSEIQKEMNQLTSEVNRIGNTTEFNTQKLLNGGGKAVSVVNAGKLDIPAQLSGGQLGATTATVGATDQLVKTFTIGGTSFGATDDGKTITFNLGGKDITLNLNKNLTAANSTATQVGISGATTATAGADAIETALTLAIAGDADLRDKYSVTAGLGDTAIKVSAKALSFTNGKLTGTDAGLNGSISYSASAAFSAATITEAVTTAGAGAYASASIDFSNKSIADLKGTGFVIGGKQIDLYDSTDGAYTGNADFAVDMKGAASSEAIVDKVVSALYNNTGAAVDKFGTSVAVGASYLPDVYVSKDSDDASKLLITAKAAGITGNAISLQDNSANDVSNLIGSDKLSNEDVVSAKGLKEGQQTVTVNYKSATVVKDGSAASAVQTAASVTVNSTSQFDSGTYRLTNTGVLSHVQLQKLNSDGSSYSTVAGYEDIDLTISSTAGVPVSLGTNDIKISGIADSQSFAAAVAGTDTYTFTIDKQHYEATLTEKDGTAGAAVRVTSGQQNVVLNAQDGTGEAVVNIGDISSDLSIGASTTYNFNTSDAKTTEVTGGKFEATFQIGANTAQSMTVEVNDMRSQSLKISGTSAGGAVTAKNGTVATLKATKEVTDGTNNTTSEYALDVSTHEKATAAISVLDDAIQSVSAERSKIGAYTNRLDHTITNLGTSSENLTAAESRVRDVDMAKEMMQFQKNNILSQAAQAMMAQANQQPQGVLQLLR